MTLVFPDTPLADRSAHPPVFAVLADQWDQCGRAFAYAARLARERGGRILLVQIVEWPEFQDWARVADDQSVALRRAAEGTILTLIQQAAQAGYDAGIVSVLMIDDDNPEVIVGALVDHPPVHAFVLQIPAAGSDPGPVVSYLTRKGLGRLPIPLVLISDAMTDTVLDRVMGTL